ncbi:MAG: hypothetical protein RL367_1927 [Pseudomonadota bacterium]|jgi:hypothetical protein
MSLDDPLLSVRGDLAARIEHLLAALPGLTRGQMAAAVDDVRKIARDHGMVPLADLASACETALSGTCSILLMRHWLESLRDVVGCHSLPADAARVWLAALGLRFHG